MDFHVFVFWNHGLYVSHITNKPSYKKRTITKFDYKTILIT